MAETKYYLEQGNYYSYYIEDSKLFFSCKDTVSGSLNNISCQFGSKTVIHDFGISEGGIRKIIPDCLFIIIGHKKLLTEIAPWVLEKQ